MGRELIEGVDYYVDNGMWVFTAHFLLSRGHCCRRNCRHCPYGATMKIEPGQYIWTSKNNDYHVTVVESLGSGPDGRQYAKIAESTTAVPVDELKKANTQNRSKKPTPKPFF